MKESMRGKPCPRYAIVAWAVLPLLLFAYSRFGPPPRSTGAPGDQTCAQASCHVGTADSGPGGVEIAFPSGLVYIPGQKQAWIVAVSDPDAKVFGFQATARLSSNPEFAQAGSFRAPGADTLVICEDGGEKPAGGACPDMFPVEFIQHSDAKPENTFHVEWTPPAEDAGPVEVYVAANAANASGSPTGDRIYTASYTLEPVTFTAAPVIRQAQPVLQAFDNSERLSPGTYVQIFGENLAATQRQWAGVDFTPGLEPGGVGPKSLDGVEVLINGKLATVSYVSPTQVNAVVPEDDHEGPVSVQVRHPGGESNTVQVDMFRLTPALLEHPLWERDGKKYVVALFSDYVTYVGPPDLVNGVTLRPARPGETLIFYALGCGPVAPPVPPGEIPKGLSRVVADFRFTFGGVEAEEADGFLAPGFVGLYQFQVKVPNVGPGDHRIELTLDGQPTGQELYITTE